MKRSASHLDDRDPTSARKKLPGFRSDFYQPWLKALQKTDAIHLRDEVLVPENAYGYAYQSHPNARQPFFQFILTEKEAYPTDLLLIQHGDFFNMWGIDAILGVEFGDLTVHRRKKGTDRERLLRCSVQVGMIQGLLDKLVEKGFTVRVYEQVEPDPLRTGLIPRVCTQTVSRALPVFYRNVRSLDLDDPTVHAPEMYVFDDSVLLVDLLNQTYRILDRLNQAAITCLLEALPDAVQFASLENLRLYRLGEGQAFDDSVGHMVCLYRVIHRYGLQARDFVEEKSTQLPLLQSTMDSLGLGDGGQRGSGGYDLIAELTGRRTRSLERRFWKQWLMYPRTSTARSHMETCTRDIMKGDYPVRSEPVLNPSTVLNTLGIGRKSRQYHSLDTIRHRSRDRVDHEGLFGVTCEYLGLSLTYENYRQGMDKIDSLLEDTLVTPTRASPDGLPTSIRGKLELYHVRSHLEEPFRQAQTRLSSALAGYPMGCMFNESEGGLYVGQTPSEADATWIRVPEVDEALAQYLAVGQQLQADQSRRLAAVSAELRYTYGLALRIFLHTQVVTRAIHRHLQHTLPRGWSKANVCSRNDPTPADLGFRGLFPVWKTPTTSTANDVGLTHRGRAVVLTAPNSVGKTTLLRSIVTGLLLANAGLLCPCATATLPELDGFVLKVGNHDCPDRNLSSFEVEMNDMNLILQTTPENSVVAIDEICMCTAYLEGLAIAQALVEYLQRPDRYLFVATHMYELLDRLDHLDHWTIAQGFCLQPGETRTSRSLVVCERYSIAPAVIVRAMALLGQDVPDRPELPDAVTIATQVTGVDPVYVPVDQLVPPVLLTTCCVYLIREGSSVWYVGETKNVATRRQQHFHTGRTGEMWVYRAANKSLALDYETRIQGECILHRIQLSSVKDSFHSPGIEL
jgi:hypothetical protein